MEQCATTLKLNQWLGGSLEKIESDDLNSHVQQCQSCQQRLDELTSHQGIDAPIDLANVLDAPTYTDEMPFREMRKKIAVKVADLKQEE